MKKKISLKINKEIFLYLVCGVVTTITNILSFYLLDKLNINLYLNNTISFLISVIISFILNKIIVFKHKSNNLKKDILLFLLLRTTSYIFDMLTISFLVEILHINKFISKLIANIVVIITNYIFSKKIIFKE